MKALPLLLALLLAWLAVASGHHLVDAPHFWGGGGPAPFPMIICFPPPVPELYKFTVALVFLGVPALFLLAWLALRGQSQSRTGAGDGGGPGDHADPWLDGSSAAAKARRLRSTR